MRQKCSDCGDKIFKIVDGQVICRQKQVAGTLEKIKKGGGSNFNVQRGNG